MTAVLASIEIEMALLGAVLRDHRVLSQMIALTPDDFAFEAHKLIWQAIDRLSSRGMVPNPPSVAQYLAQDETISEIGGQRYLLQLATTPLGTLPAPGWARELRDLSAKRRLVAIASEAKERAESDGALTSDELAADMMRDIEAVTADSAPRVRDLRDVRVTEAAALDKPLPCYSTGYDCLDLAMGGGLFARRCYGIAGRKKSGKTLIAGGISSHLNERGVKHLYVACEMGSDQIEHRCMAKDLGVNALYFLDPRWRADRVFQERVTAYALKCPNNKVYLDAPGITFDQLRSDVTNTIITHQVKGVILDYLQLVGGQRKGQSRAEHIDEVSQWIAETAKKRDVWFLVLAQMNQEGNIRGGEGLRLAFDQVYELKRAETGDGAWLEMLDTRYTKWMEVGSAEQPAFMLEQKIGPHFREVGPISEQEQAA